MGAAEFVIARMLVVSGVESFVRNGMKLACFSMRTVFFGGPDKDLFMTLPSLGHIGNCSVVLTTHRSIAVLNGHRIDLFPFAFFWKEPFDADGRAESMRFRM